MRKLLLFWTIGAQVITWGGQAHGPSSRDVKPSAMGTQRLVGTLFDTRHTSATLRLLNKGPREVDVRLQAYSRSGRREDMTTATIMGNDITMIDLNAGFPEVGWLELEYEGKPLELGGQIIHRSRKGEPLFDEQLVNPGSSFQSNDLEAAWWVPARSDLKIVVVNIGHDDVEAELKLFDESGPSATRSLFVPARSQRFHQIPVQANSAGYAAVTHNGSAGSVLARVITSAKKGAFSAAFDFIDPSTLNAGPLHGADVASGDWLPIIVVTNRSNKVSHVTAYASTEQGDLLPAASARLGAHSTKALALEISRVEGEAPARGIEIHSDEEPVPLMAAAMLLHQSTQVSRRIPLVSSNQIPGSAGGFPWRVNSETDTLVHIKNITSEDQDYRIELRDNQGSVFSLGRKSIPAHGSLSLDLAAILAQVPIDENGSGLPASSSSGQVLWSSLGTDSKALIARAEEVEQRSGRSTSYSCFNCCPDSFFRASITSPSDGSEQLQLTARQQDANCYGTVMSPYQVFNASWSVADPSVATIDSNGNVFEGSDAGETDAFAAWVAVAFDFGGETGGTECAMTTPFALALGRIGSALTNFEFKDKVDSTADRLCRWEESCTMGKNPPTCFDDPLIVARIPLHRQCAAYLARAGLTFRDEDTGQVKCFPIGLVTEFNMPTPCT